MRFKCQYNLAEGRPQGVWNSARSRKSQLVHVLGRGPVVVQQLNVLLVELLYKCQRLHPRELHVVLTFAHELNSWVRTAVEKHLRQTIRLGVYCHDWLEVGCKSCFPDL